MDGDAGSRKKDEGFSLVELFVVLLIIGVLAVIAYQAYRTYLDKARITVSLSLLDSVRKDLEAYKNEHAAYPATINFADFTDQNGRVILSAVSVATTHDKVFSWDSYVTDGQTYTMTVKAIDSRHTIMEMSPQGTVKH